MRNFCLSLFLLVCSVAAHAQYTDDTTLCSVSNGGATNTWINTADGYYTLCDMNLLPQKLPNLVQLAAFNFAQRATCVLSSDYTTGLFSFL